MRRAFATIALAAGLMGPALTGCSTLKGVQDWLGGPDPSLLELTISATDADNPDVTGRPSPVNIRLYQLRAAAVFEGADFFALNDSDRQLLAADLLKREEFMILPGQTKTLSDVALQDGCNFIAVFAEFRDVSNTHWRAVAKVVPKDAEYKGEVKLDKSTVVLSVEED